MDKKRSEITENMEGDEVTVSEKWELTNWDGCWNANADVRLSKMYNEVLKHERFDDILHMAQWSETALPHIAKSRDDWEPQPPTPEEMTRSGTTHTLRDRAGEMGSFTMSYCSGWCKHVPEDDFVWFYVDDGAHSKNNLRSGWLARGVQTVGRSMNIVVSGCVVVMQHNENTSESVVFMTGMPTQVTNTTFSAFNVGQQCSCTQDEQKRSKGEGYLQDSQRPLNRRIVQKVYDSLTPGTPPNCQA